MLSRFRLIFLFLLAHGAFLVPGAWSEISQIAANADGDQYLFRPTYNGSRSYMNVGQYYGGFSTHYYVGLANWNELDLSPLGGLSSANLAVYVQNFVDPVFGNGVNAQPTSFTYPKVGNFNLKVVALSGTPTPSLIDDAWVKTNLVDAAGVGSITLTHSGYSLVNIGNTVANWIAAGNSPRWLGFVGTGSTTSLYTSVQLGTLEADGAIITEAAPMYLTAPTPAPVARASRIISANEMEITFDVVPSVSYNLKTKSNLSDSNWITVSSFVAGSSSTNLTVPMTNSLGRGFFRLEVAAP